MKHTTNPTPRRLEVHVTDGGAVYVTDNHRFADAEFIVRIDANHNRNPEAMGRLFAASPDLLTALRATLPALALLGNYIGNEWNGGGGIDAFDRCAIILAAKDAIAKAKDGAS